MKRKLSIIFLTLFFSTLLVFASEESDKKFDAAMDLYKSGKKQESMKVAKDAIAMDSNNSIYYTFLGNIYKELKQYDESEKYYLYCRRQ